MKRISRKWLIPGVAIVLVVDQVGVSELVHHASEGAYALRVAPALYFGATADDAELEAALADGSYRRALARGKQALAREPDRPELRLLVADSYAALGKHDAAVQEYNRLLNGSHGAAARLGLFEVYRAVGEDESAMQALRGPDREGRLHRSALGVTDLASERAPGAVAQLPGAERASLEAVRQAVEAQAYRVALMRAMPLLEAGADISELRLLVGRSYRMVGRHEEALAELTGLLSGPLEAQARVEVFEVYAALGQPREAAVALRGAGAVHRAPLDRLQEHERAIPTQPPRDPLLPPPGTALGALEPQLKSDPMPEVARVLEAYWAGDYEAVVRDGPAVLKRHPDHHDLRLALANSLAWSGRHQPALDVYRPLLETEHRGAALAGIGQIYRWLEEPVQAEAYLREALELAPEDGDLREAYTLIGRELRPRTRFQLGRTRDSTDAEVLTGMTSHRFWTEDRRTRLEVGASATRSEREPVTADRQNVELTVEQPDAPLAPRVRLQAQAGDEAALFGDVTLQLGTAPFFLTFGSIDWGLNDPFAAADQLRATQGGAAGTVEGRAGRLDLSYDHYWIEGGNEMQQADAAYTPAWQPWADSPVEVFASFYGRRAAEEDDRYWTPTDGYYTVGPGVRVGLYQRDWELNASARVGLPLNGDSATAWSAEVDGRRWLSEDVAVGGEVMVNRSQRDDDRYRGHSAGIFLEVLW